MKYFVQVFSILALVGLSISIYEILSGELNDTFDIINESIWKYETRRSYGQDCYMFRKAVSLEEGAATVSLSKTDFNVAQQYKSGGLSSLKSFKDGLFKIRARQRAAAGTICSFVLESPWNSTKNEKKEISINLLGAPDNKVFLSTRHITWSEGETAFNHEYTFEESSTRQYHEYVIKWADSLVEFHIDGEMIFETNKILFDEPMNIKLVQWAVHKTEIPELYQWIGPVDENNLPSTLYVDQLTMKPIHLFADFKSPFKF